MSKQLIPRTQFTSSELARPSEEEIASSTQLTQLALDKIVQAKISKTQPKSVALSVTTRDGATYIRYKSTSLLSNGAPMERLIKIVDKQNDPMLPPKFLIKKLPQGPPPPPAPILHDPSEKLTQQDHKDWYIPPAISNWKNQNGFTIAIDKRMSYLNNTDTKKDEINENFGHLNEALLKAEKDAREEIALKNEMMLKLKERENQEREMKLKELAQKSYNNRSRHQSERLSSSDYHSARQREISREERRRKAEREIKLSNEQRLRNNGVSERVIQAAVKNNKTEPEFDSRLYNKAEGALVAGYSDDEDDLVRSTPVEFERDGLVSTNETEFGLEPDLKKQRRD